MLWPAFLSSTPPILSRLCRVKREFCSRFRGGAGALCTLDERSTARAFHLGNQGQSPWPVSNSRQGRARLLASICRETRKGAAGAVPVPEGRRIVAQGGAERPQPRSGTLGIQKNRPKPRKGRRKTLLDQGSQRPSLALPGLNPMSCRGPRVSLRCTLGYNPPPPPGAETHVWLTFPGFATETS